MVNMSSIFKIRNKYKETFKEKHGVSLGFMSFFTKAGKSSQRVRCSFNDRWRSSNQI